MSKRGRAVSSPDNEEYIVEKIVQKRIRRGQKTSVASPIKLRASTIACQAPLNNAPAEMHGFKRGLIAERIVGATMLTNELWFLIKWHGTDKADLVFSAEANKTCPQVVIQFYEDRLQWKDTL